MTTFAGAWSTWQLTQWLDGIQAADTWLGLADDDPFSVVDPLTVELSGGGYTRPKVTSWLRPGPKLLRVHNLSTWTGVTPGSTVRAVMGFDAATNGNMRFAVFLPSPVTIGVSGGYIVPADSLYVGLDL